jgi:hypothetical protein
VREEFTGSIGIIHLAHIWTVISIFAGAAILGELHSRKEQKRERRTKK